MVVNVKLTVTCSLLLGVPTYRYVLAGNPSGSVILDSETARVKALATNGGCPVGCQGSGPGSVIQTCTATFNGACTSLFAETTQCTLTHSGVTPCTTPQYNEFTLRSLTVNIA